MDNAFLPDEGEEDSDTEGDSQEEAQAEAEDACTGEFSERPREPWVVVPINDDERKLTCMVDNDQIAENEPQFASDADDCGGCSNALDKYGVFIDGRLRGQLTWATLCAKCFIHIGEGVGWGKGQLYARQPNGDWRLVAGFPPKESD